MEHYYSGQLPKISSLSYHSFLLQFIIMLMMMQPRSQRSLLPVSEGTCTVVNPRNEVDDDLGNDQKCHDYVR